MSRIGKKPITIPAGVTVTVSGRNVAVKGPKGELKREMHPDINVEVKDGMVTVERPSEEQMHRALHGLSRSLVQNMVDGVTKGFQKQLEIVGVGYKAEVRPYGLQLALGLSHPVEYRAPAGIKLSAPQPTSVLVDGADKEKVGQVAAELRSLRPPEPYKGKGIKYAGEHVRRKAGKAGKAGGKV
jgi:large subunit ribosomal protein L6